MDNSCSEMSAGQNQKHKIPYCHIASSLLMEHDSSLKLMAEVMVYFCWVTDKS